MKKRTPVISQKPLDLFYLGPVYHERSLVMGELYDIEDREHRLAWSLLGSHLDHGQSITIRLATPEEHAWAEAETVRNEAWSKRLREGTARRIAAYDKRLTTTSGDDAPAT